MSYVRQFVRFLYDFLVGDAWELFVGPIVGLVIAWGALQAGMSAAATGGLLFVTVLIVAAINISIGVRSSD